MKSWALAALRRRDDLVHRRVEPAVADVVGDRAENSSGSCSTMLICCAQRLERERLDVEAVEQDPPAARVVEPREQADQRALAGAGRPDDRDRLPGPASKRDVRRACRRAR